MIDINFKPRISEYYDVETQCNTLKENQDSDSDDDIVYQPVERRDSVRYVIFVYHLEYARKYC